VPRIWDRGGDCAPTARDTTGRAAATPSLSNGAVRAAVGRRSPTASRQQALRDNCDYAQPPRRRRKSAGTGTRQVALPDSVDFGDDELPAGVERTIEEGRSPILLTERKDHLQFFAERLESFVRHVVVLQGGMSRKERRARGAQLDSIPDNEERLVLATGRYIGEGFNDARLDTLFLALPVAWKGTLVQYTGRLHRLHPRKTEVRIFDYVDRGVPVLLKMFEKRLRGYRAIGYARDEAPLGFAAPPDDESVVEWDEAALRHFDEDD
jgi:hypothetical protein